MNWGAKDLYSPEENTIPDYLDQDSTDITHLGRYRVSSQKGDLGLEYLLDNSRSTFWQSDGSLPHFVEVQFAKVVKVSSVAIFTDRRIDESYTPLYIEVFAGYGRFDLIKVNGYELQGKEGWERLEWEARGNSLAANEDGVVKPYISCSFLRVAIRRNYQNGKDTRIKGLRILGPRSDLGIDAIMSAEEVTSNDTAAMRQLQRPRFERV